MALDAQTTKILTIVMLLVWAVFGGLFGWCIKELSRIDPFYTPLECTNVYGLFAMGAPGTALQVSGHKTEMECTNKNQMKIDITAGTGDMLYVKADDTTKDVGDVKLDGAVSMAIDSQANKIKMTLSMTMPAADVTAMGAALAAQATANVTIPAVPMLFSLKLDTRAEMAYLFSKFSDSNFIPKKYCGFLVQVLPAGTYDGTAMPAGALKSVSVTTCADSAADAITAVKALAKDGGPSSANDNSAGYISGMDPTSDYLAEKEGDVATAMGIFTRVFAILSMIGVGMAMTCSIMWYRVKGGA